ncbi:MAG: AbrB/MazE/SpoVT family DNA-binding domain-containing protein [Synechococcus lacustris]|jgi:AbrB family looped-hinge helix DNA binding protein
MDAVTLSSKFQVVIPQRLRELYGLKAGQRLQWVALAHRLELVPLQPATALRGFLPGENNFDREVDRL